MHSKTFCTPNGKRSKGEAMCKWGTQVKRMLPVQAAFSRTGKRYVREWPIDACIAPLVDALNDAGIATAASCCGHGKGPGHIVTEDGRVLEIHKLSEYEWCAAKGAKL